MISEIDIQRGLTALEATIRGQERAAACVMADMTPEGLHELIRNCLLGAGLARESILAPATPSTDPSGARTAHRAVEALSPPLSAVMGYFRRPDIHGTDVHEECGYTWHDHGWIDSHHVGGDGITVCPSTIGPFPGQTVCLSDTEGDSGS